MVIRPLYLIAGGAVVAAAVYAYLKINSPTGSVGYDIGYAVGGGVYDAFDGVVSGVVLNAGDAVGVPRTDMTECEKAKAEGRTWDASFACPAGEFLSYLWN